MTITNCPMCRTELPIGETLRACGKCGADLSRYIPKQPPLPKLVAHEGEPVEESTGSQLGRGILGALAGAVIGSVVMFGLFALTGFRFPLLGTGIGLLTGLLAKRLYGAEDEKLGMISGGVAMVAVVGTLYLMYGEFPFLNIISVVVSVSVAYRVASS